MESMINFDFSNAEKSPVWSFFLKTSEEFVSCILQKGIAEKGIADNFYCRISPCFSDLIALNGYGCIQIDQKFLKQIVVTTNAVITEYQSLQRKPIRDFVVNIKETRTELIKKVEQTDELWKDFENKYKNGIPKVNIQVFLGCFEFMINHEFAHSKFSAEKLSEIQEETKCDESATYVIKTLICNALTLGNASDAEYMLLGAILAQFNIALRVRQHSSVETDKSHPPTYKRTLSMLKILTKDLTFSDDLFCLPMYFFALIYSNDDLAILEDNTSFLEAFKCILNTQAAKES